MIAQVISWIEGHRVTVGLIQTVTLLLIAWFTGIFRLVVTLTRKPKVRIVETASMVFIESPNIEGKESEIRAAFILNASIINSSREKIVLDQFLLSYQTLNPFRSHKQKLVRIAFPSRPRKRVGTGLKMMGVWFTNFAGDEYPLPPAMGCLESMHMESGYLLFLSYTWGGWSPAVADGKMRIRLKALLTSGEVLVHETRIRAISDSSVVSELCPGIIEHIADESTWNHDLSIFT
jgi:hypothetical protein